MTRSLTRPAIAAAVVVATLLALGTVRAESERRPWAAGVSEADQALALGLYNEGNTEYAELRFAQALTKYRQALVHWDHPAIRFNIAVCLIHLDRLIEAKEELERALAYGAAPLGDTEYREGLTYRKLLDAQLSKLTITCAEPDAEVTLDGAHLFTGPGAATRYLVPGPHQVVVTKPGFLTASETVLLGAGGATASEIRLVAFPDSTPMARRWWRGTPFAVAGAGALVTAVGALVYRASARSFDAYDAAVRDACGITCNAIMLAELPHVLEIRRRAERERTVAISTFVAGGAVLATSAILLYLNQPRAREAPSRPRATVAPVPAGAALSLGWSF